jgi:hypothetical protein
MKQFILKNFTNVIMAGLFAGVPVIVTCQTNSSGSMPQYLFKDFAKSEIKLKRGESQTQMMNYNKVTEKMIFTRDNQYYELTNAEIVDTIFLNDCKFVPVGKTFYEVLADGPATLFIQHKSSLLPAGKQVGYGGTSQIASADYLSSVKLQGGQYNLPLPSDYIVNDGAVYWIRKGDIWSDFNNEKQFLKIFPVNSVQIKDFIRKNRIKFDKPDNLVKLVMFCNTL